MDLGRLVRLPSALCQANVGEMGQEVGRRGCLTLVGLLRDEAGDVTEMLDVEGAERGAQAEGGGGDEGVNQAQPVREVQAAEVDNSLQRLGIRGPDEGQGESEPISGERLLLVLRALIEFHKDIPRQGKAAGGGGSVPGSGGGVPALNIYHHVGIQKANSLRSHAWGRFSVCSRIAWTYSVLSAYFLPGPMSLYCSAQTSKHPFSSQ